MKEVWISAYLYHAEPWEEFLIKAVKPFVESRTDSLLINEFFYIRYWEKGPHIRLRLKVNEADKAIVEKEVHEYFSKWFRHNSSRRKYTDTFWQENNIVVFETYQPEVVRYGGMEAMVIAEKIFFLSSKIVLQIMQEEKSWDYQKALTSAICMHLSFIHAAGMNEKEYIPFFSYISQQWLFSMLRRQPAFQEEYLKHKEHILNAFERSYEQIHNTLIPFMNDFMVGLNNIQEYEDAWISDWHEGLKEYLQDLKNVLLSGQFTNVDHSGVLKEKNIPLLWSIYSSLIHMTNNRLGILNRDESYLGFLISRSFASAI